MKSRSAFALKIAVVGCAALLLPWGGESPGRVSAEGAPTFNLKHGFDALRRGEIEQAQKHFREAQKDETLRGWAAVGEAMSLEASGKTKDALECLEKVKADEAAATDAEVLRLSLAPEKLLIPEVANRQQVLQRLGREDLITRLLSTAAGEALRRKDHMRAWAFYQELRPRLFRHYSLPVAATPERAQALFDSLIPGFTEPERDSALLFEAQQSLAARDSARALQLLDRRRLRDAAGEVTRAKALRASGKSAEAIQNLLESSSSLDSGRDTALLELVRLLWNENRLQETREYARKYLSAYGTSSAADEVRHSAALSWITGGDWPKGIAELETIASAKQRSDYQTLSQRDLAWLSVRKGDWSTATRWFASYRAANIARLDAAKRETAASDRAKKSRDAKFELEHSTYWLAVACTKARATSSTACKNHSPEQLFRTLQKESPLSYYGMLAASKLGLSFPPPEYIAAGAEKVGGLKESCSSELPPSVKARLAALQEEELPALVHIELSFLFGGKAAAEPTSAAAPPGDILSSNTCRLALYSRYGDAPAGLQLADSLLKEPQTTVPLRALVDAAFPIPYRHVYEREAAARNVPLPFALAITRTESHFDPSARSTSDARGLMQLLPKTARSEGMEDPEQLFQAEANIQVGIKHIAGLFRSLQGDEDLVAGAYNGGQNAVLRWKGRTTPRKPRPVNDFVHLGMDAWIETIPYGETRNYIKKVRLAKKWYARLSREQSSASGK